MIKPNALQRILTNEERKKLTAKRWQKNKDKEGGKRYLMREKRGKKRQQNHNYDNNEN